MKATKENIREILGINGEGIEFLDGHAGNGYRLRGFLKRSALTDLMNNFHVYINKVNDVVVISPGMEGTAHNQL